MFSYIFLLNESHRILKRSLPAWSRLLIHNYKEHLKEKMSRYLGIITFLIKLFVLTSPKLVDYWTTEPAFSIHVYLGLCFPVFCTLLCSIFVDSIYTSSFWASSWSFATIEGYNLCIRGSWWIIPRNTELKFIQLEPLFSNSFNLELLLSCFLLPTIKPFISVFKLPDGLIRATYLTNFELLSV